MACSKRPPMDDRSSSTCGVCLQRFDDPRLLDCLHSFCRSCVDHLAVTSSSSAADRDGGGRHVRCPLCRSSCSIPEKGAVGLVKDTTQLSSPRDELQCRACKEDGKDGKTTSWCTQCEVAYCSEHALPHMLASQGHAISALPQNGQPSLHAGPPQPEHATCCVHGQPFVYHCISCSVDVCGHCTAFGDHIGHKPVVLMKDMIDERKQAVFAKVSKLQNDVLPEAEDALAAFARVSNDLASQADKVREQVRAAGRRMVGLVEECVAQQLQRVEDIDQSRSKELDKQHDELKEIVEGIKTVVGFSEAFKESTSVTEQGVGTLLPALERRAQTLSDAGFKKTPPEHAQPDLFFVEEGGEEKLRNELKGLFGIVSRHKASAAHSTLDYKLPVADGHQVKVTIQAMDQRGQALVDGGDMIKHRWLTASSAVPVDVTDNGDGTYALSFIPKQRGPHHLNVFLNGAKIPRAVVMDLTPMTFNPDMCQDGIHISCHDRKATCRVPSTKNPALLGQRAMEKGLHRWKVAVGKEADHLRIVGVSAEFDKSTRGAFKRAYVWNGYHGKPVAMGTIDREKEGKPWEHNDVIDLQLDCDRHVLRLTNLRSGETEIIENLPERQLFAFFSLCGPGMTMTLVD